MSAGAHILTSPDRPALQLRDVFRWQVECALQELESSRSRAASVHGARKQLKKARATLRLLRCALPKAAYQREDAAMRDAARPLSAARDAEVVKVTFDALLRRSESEGAAFDRLGRALVASLLREHHKSDLPGTIVRVRAMLDQAHRRASRWELLSDDWAIVLEGLVRTYRRGRVRLQTARQTPTTEHLHDWRKQAKYMWHQLQVLTPLAPGELGELADQFHRLSDYLGDEHDLAVLGEQLQEIRGHRDAIRKLRGAIAAGREDLHARAFALGERLYADKAVRFSERLDALWTSWRKASESRHGLSAHS